MRVFHQLTLLIWKNLLFRRRHYIITTFEIILPTLLILILAILRSNVERKFSSEPNFSRMTRTADTSSRTFDIKSESSAYDQAQGNFENGNAVFFSPNTSFVTEIMDEVKRTLRLNKTDSRRQPLGFPTETAAVNYVNRLVTEIARRDDRQRTERDKYKVLIVFEQGIETRRANFIPPPGFTFSYKIRIIKKIEYISSVDDDDALFPPAALDNFGYSERTGRYFDSGFTGLQIALDKALIWTLARGVEPNYEYAVGGMPVPENVKIRQGMIAAVEEYSDNDKFRNILVEFLVVGYLFVVPSVIRPIVSEKETGIKELMKMMGMPNWIHWLGWMFNSLLVLIVTNSIVTFLTFVTIDAEIGGLLINADFILYWIVLLLFAMAITTFCFFISTIFQKGSLAVTFGILFYVVIYTVWSILIKVYSNNLTLTHKLVSCLLPFIGLYWYAYITCDREGSSNPAYWQGWSNLFEPYDRLDSFCVGHVCLMLILDVVLYMTLTIYLENVIPSEFGLTKPIYYPFQISRYRTSRRVNPEPVEEAEVRPGFEPEPTNIEAGVVIRNLRKQFPGHKLAVNMMGTLKMYDGEITALLGHNGAGKTTTLSILTGLFSPTSGTATVNGYDIRKNMDEVRQSLGLCPQHDMLFAELTVKQHLLFFGMLKGLSYKQAKAESEFLLWKMRFVDKKDTMAKDLSGGQKRKLCLGMALIGGTKVLILDEPTSGMDPEARRVIWDLLLEMRGKRTIILTTHFMEEADVLGDRIAIMAEGQVKCCGSPAFLKNYYGAGYTLKMTVTNAAVAPNILAVVQNLVPDAQLKPNSSGNVFEVDIKIPKTSQSNSIFPGLFGALGSAREKLGIITVGLSLATMDDIFVKVGEDEDDAPPQPVVTPIVVDVIEEDEEENENETDTDYQEFPNSEVGPNVVGRGTSHLSEINLWLQQFIGIFQKRSICSFRRRKLFFIQFLLPLVMLIGSLLLTNVLLAPPKRPNTERLRMELSAYDAPVTLYASTNSNLTKAYAIAVGKSAKLVTAVNETVFLNVAAENGWDTYKNRYIVAGNLNDRELTAYFSPFPNHASPLSVNLMSNAILEEMNLPGCRIKVSTHPIYFRAYSFDLANGRGFMARILIGTMVPIGLILLVSSYIVLPVEERLSNVKQLQLMTGINPALFWAATFLWDFVAFCILSLLMLICILTCQPNWIFTANQGWIVIFLILILYGFSAISFTYLVSTFMTSIPGGFSLLTIVHLLTGILISVICYELDNYGLPLNPHFLGFMRLFPTFSLTRGILRWANVAILTAQCDYFRSRMNECFKPNYFFKWNIEQQTILTGLELIPGISQDLFYLFLVGLLYLILFMIFEFGLFRKLNPEKLTEDATGFDGANYSADDDVQAEKNRIASLVAEGRVAEDALMVNNLCKSFGSFAAVSGLTFGVHYGECFGLLGVNGAGKTTAFRMLTGDEVPSAGTAFSQGIKLDHNRSKFLQTIGYCPQFDGIIGVLTGKEMLDLFGRLRGIPWGQVDFESNKWLNHVGLLESGKVQCGKYSGGMKRRLCAAIAMVGDPSMILLDEPTSGVDPIARRKFWKVLGSVRDAGQAVVLTSHSMEECEALCSRLGIMVNGQIQCLGGVQHLKAKFAQGYKLVVTVVEGELEVKVEVVEKVIEEGVEIEKTVPKTELDLLCDTILKTFPCFLREKHQRILEFQIVGTELGWGDMFSLMEGVKGQYANFVADYSITETTLEEVFLSFARTQFPERVVKTTCCNKCFSCACK